MEKVDDNDYVLDVSSLYKGGNLRTQLIALYWASELYTGQKGYHPDRALETHFLNHLIENVVDSITYVALMNLVEDPFDNPEPSETQAADKLGSRYYVFKACHEYYVELRKRDLWNNRRKLVYSGTDKFGKPMIDRKIDFSNQMHFFLSKCPHLWLDDFERPVIRDGKFLGSFRTPGGFCLPFVWLNILDDHNVVLEAWRWHPQLGPLNINVYHQPREGVESVDVSTDLGSYSMYPPLLGNRMGLRCSGPALTFVVCSWKTKNRIRVLSPFRGLCFFLLLTDNGGDLQVLLNNEDLDQQGVYGIEPVFYFCHYAEDNDVDLTSTDTDTFDTDVDEEW
jgi:hypothetical protein